MQKLEPYKTSTFGSSDLGFYEANVRPEYGDNNMVCQPLEALPTSDSSVLDVIDFADMVHSKEQSQQTVCHLFALDHYLVLDTASHCDILRYWKEHKSIYPGLVQIAQDVLAVPVSGAGVERYIFAARLICSYQQNGLNAKTIKQLIIMRSVYNNCNIKWKEVLEDEEDEKEQ